MEKSPAPALSKGLYIVDLVAEEEALSFSQLQKHTGYNVSSLNRYLKVLLEAGYLIKNNEQKYILGLKPTRLANYKSMWRRLIQESRSRMKQLTDTYEVTILLLGFGDQQYTCLAKTAHKDNLTMMNIGHTETVIKSNIPWGVAYGASNQEEDMSHEMKEAIQVYDSKGYFTYKSGKQNEVTRVAVPIKDRHNQVIGVLGMGTFSNKLSSDKLEHLIKDMIEVGNAIQTGLDY